MSEERYQITASVMVPHDDGAGWQITFSRLRSSTGDREPAITIVIPFVKVRDVSFAGVYTLRQIEEMAKA